MDLEEKLGLVSRNSEEIVTENELRAIIETGSKPRAYWGFEPSGLMHIGAMLCARKISDMIKAGFRFIVFLADWHAWINNKLGGELEEIRACGEYLKICFTGLGIDPNSVQYTWASDLAADCNYWKTVIDVGRTSSLQRVRRSLPVMGRDMEAGDMEAAAVFYPCMQAADIFYLDIDVACAGIDQRKAHMLARDAAEKLKAKKPTCVHTPVLVGLSGETTIIKPGGSEARFDEDPGVSTKIASKMSKSRPGDCILLNDKPDMIMKKIEGAYCPPIETDSNPLLQIARYIVLAEGCELVIERPAKYGGQISFTKFAVLEDDYRQGKIHPLDLKNAVARSLIRLLEPVRREFEKNREIVERVESIDRPSRGPVR